MSDTQLTKEDLKQLQDSTTALVREVGDYVIDEWQKEHEVSFKDARDIATEVDIEAEKRLRAGLHEIFPEAGFIVEEGKNVLKRTHNWIIDPLDQTKKYVSSLPLYFVHVGLLDAYDKCILGHVYNPVSKQLFSGSLGNGASLNGKSFNIDPREDPKNAIVDINFSGKSDVDWKMNKLSILAKNYYRIQISSNAFSVYLLTGFADCYVALADVKDPVDILPRVIIFEEAGLKAEHMKLENRDIWLIANPALFDKTLALLKSS